MIDRVKQNYAAAEVSDKLKSLLAIAGKAQKRGKHVTPEDVAQARQQGATDKEIHDTVLIAAAFCMYNRYVDGLATWAPTDADLGIARMEGGSPKKDTSIQPTTCQQARRSVRNFSARLNRSWPHKRP